MWVGEGYWNTTITAKGHTDVPELVELILKLIKGRSIRGGHTLAVLRNNSKQYWILARIGMADISLSLRLHSGSEYELRSDVSPNYGSKSVCGSI